MEQPHPLIHHSGFDFSPILHSGSISYFQDRSVALANVHEVGTLTTANFKLPF